MKVLVACEESQAVCKAFRERGHEAYSCDIQECSGGHPEWHIKNDVLSILNGNCEFAVRTGESIIIDKWDMVIAHPPCTYLSNAGARWLYEGGAFNYSRYQKGIIAKNFFMQFFYANCQRIAIENPVPSAIYNLPPYSQIIQPWMFGHPVQKKTCLWLKGLPLLVPTKITEEKQPTNTPGNWFNKGGKERQKNRAKTFYGVACAMAEQWGNLK